MLLYLANLDERTWPLRKVSNNFKFNKSELMKYHTYQLHFLALLISI